MSGDKNIAVVSLLEFEDGQRTYLGPGSFAQLCNNDTHKVQSKVEMRQLFQQRA